MKYFDIRYYAFGIADLVAKGQNQPHSERYKYYYGSYVVLSSIWQITLFLTVSLFLGIFKEALIAIAAFATLRWYAGGAHSTSLRSCTTISLMIIMGSVYIGKLINIYVSLPMFLMAFILLMIYSPSDHKNLPINDPKTRILYKRISIVIFLGWFAAALLFPSITGIITMAIFIECVSLIKSRESLQPRCNIY